MAGLGEEIEGLDVLYLVAGCCEFLEIAHLGGGLTGDVNASGGSETEELI